MATLRARRHCRERLVRLSESSLECEAIQREAIVELRRVIGFDRWCWPFADPATLLPLTGLAEHDYGPRLSRALELEFSGEDFAAKHVLARQTNSAVSLNVETGGDLARSPRWDEVMRPVGIGDVAAVACRDELGCWGWIEAYRDGGDRRFDQEDLDLLGDVGTSLGGALRRSLVAATDGGAPQSSPPGVIVLGPDLRLVSWTAAARDWIDALPAAQLFAGWGMLPPMVYPAATLARSGEAAQAHARLRAVDGRWVMIEAAPLEGREDGQLAVTLRSATARETLDLLCRVYALSARERDVVELVVAGLETRAIAARLFISAHTVQDHLKSVFEKVGIHSRRELLVKLGSAADGGVDR